MKHFSSSMRVEIKNFRVKGISTAIAVLVRPTSFSQLNDFVVISPQSGQIIKCLFVHGQRSFYGRWRWGG